MCEVRFFIIFVYFELRIIMCLLIHEFIYGNFWGTNRHYRKKGLLKISQKRQDKKHRFLNKSFFIKGSKSQKAGKNSKYSTSYTSISIRCLLDKIFKKIIIKRILNFWGDNDIIKY